MNMQSEKGEEVNKINPIIIYEDDDVVVINKPYNWLTHDDGHHEGVPLVVDWLLNYCPEAKGVGEVGYSPQGEELNRSGVVHRLDRETSGALLLAKHQEAYQHLKHQFQNRAVYKEYRAFVYGRLNDRWGTINRPIGRSAKDHRRRSAERGAKGVRREAITDFERIGMGEYLDEPFSYVKLVPKTGRTHQLRVHLRALDRPIVKDELYAEHKIGDSNNLGLDRMALHAYQLGLVLPNGNSERFLAPIPLSFEEAAERIAD
jgi:23S rRNA pseudouridine1911/1915/1917 synthase